MRQASLFSPQSYQQDLCGFLGAVVQEREEARGGGSSSEGEGLQCWSFQKLFFIHCPPHPRPQATAHTLRVARGSRKWGGRTRPRPAIRQLLPVSDPHPAGAAVTAWDWVALEGGLSWALCPRPRRPSELVVFLSV